MRELRGPGKLLHRLLVVLLVMWTVLPFLWLFISSICPHAELLSYPVHWIPHHPTLANYREILDTTSSVGSKFLLGLRNSFTVSASVTLACLLFGALGAYALARMPVPGKRSFLLSFMIIRMLPSIALIIPFYVIVIRISRYVPLFDTTWNLSLLYNSFILGFALWILRGYFLTLPRELEEAALIDGCTPAQTLWKVVLPLAAPGLVATGIFSFLLAWDEFLFALIFTRTTAMTAPVVIAELGSQYITAYESIAATGFLASLPPILLALLFQKYIVSGLTGGGIK
ncbi:MAG: carbohydrate ABC transporter permease [Armatimonadetes bacterium]|nr:carbohydrate ABC transporter permease [Armatimonadota bacterium]